MSKGEFLKLVKGIGLGTFPFANPFTSVDERMAEKIVGTFLDLGGMFIDTSPTYGSGYVEELLGKILKKYGRSTYFLNTSCGYIQTKEGRRISGKYQDVVDNCNKSLKRLGLDYIDLYISHIPDSSTSFSETVQALEALMKQGKIRQIGVSNVSLNQLKEYNATGSIKFVHNRFSLLNHSFDKTFTDYCIKHDVAIVSYQVIERGLLTSKIVNGLTLKSTDLRNRKPEFTPNIVQDISIWVRDYLQPVSDRLNMPLSAIAIWWALKQPAVALCSIGATQVSQVRENFCALSIEESKCLLESLDRAYLELETTIKNRTSLSIREFLTN